MDELVKEMEAKINKILDMCAHMYIAAEFGNRFAMKERAENIASKTFILQRQMKELGLIDYEKDQEAEKEFTELCEKALEFIINSYGNVVTEVVTQQYVNNAINNIDMANNTENAEKVTDTAETENDKGVQFKEDNLNELMNFIGM